MDLEQIESPEAATLYDRLVVVIEKALKNKDLERIVSILKLLSGYKHIPGTKPSPEFLTLQLLRSQGYLTRLYSTRDSLHKSADMYAIKEDSSLPTVVYHITPAQNLRSIMQHGLKPQVGDRSVKLSNELTAVYCFPDKSSLEDAMTNWLGDEFDEDEQLALLSINTSNLQGSYTPNAEYEVAITSVIPPSNIKILSKDIDTYVMESSGYIPSEAEKNDPRWKMALTADVNPYTMKKSAKKFGWKIKRDGSPPILR